MGEYLFRFPSNMPALTFDGLKNVERIGATVTVRHWPASTTAVVATERYSIVLYHTVVAYVGKHDVHFPKHGDHHQATREWLAQIVRDNGIGTSVYRNRKGELVIDGERPLEGQTFAVKRS